MFAAQKRVQTLVHPTWVVLVAFFFDQGSNAAINYKKSLTLTALQAVEQISNDIAKYRFPLTKKRQQPRIKTQSSSTQACFFSPNSLMTTFIFRKTMAISLLWYALARIVYDASGNPIETIFINWDKVTDIRINKGELLYYARFYKSIISISIAFQELHTTES
jgi:phage portal protein BeeE